MKEIALPSGNKATLGDSDFESSLELQDYLATEIKNLPASEFEKGVDTSLISLAKYAPALISKKELRDIIFRCGTRCVIAGKSFAGNLSPDYFKEPLHRADYFPLMKEVAQNALTPFIQGLKAMDIHGILKKIKN